MGGRCECGFGRCVGGLGGWMYRRLDGGWTDWRMVGRIEEKVNGSKDRWEHG